MPPLEIIRDRYDGQTTISSIRVDHLKSGKTGPYIEVPLGDDAEFAIYFETANGEVDDALLAAARSLMSQINLIDNLVQNSCAAECMKSGLHPRNFEGELVFVTLSYQKARLRYFGTGVNTEWDEVAELRDGNWVHIGTVNPDLSARNK